MQITRLRLLGFKSFVEPSELLIEPGLTGVVGPNGCGKSNLLEGLRWVMGETSYKSMRGSGMDDVIFAGTKHRPARNTAAVTMFIDNLARTLPAAYNDDDQIEITRRIERDTGSEYRINHKTVRARDVQLLFADAATGARSQALVQQGRIGEIVNAKPELRRRILEEAAGITGLHSRRHEAELKLRAADNNLERLQDILGQLSSQLQSLKRQARQAARYRQISGDIRRLEALHLYLSWQSSADLLNEEETALAEALLGVGAQTKAEAEALRHQTEAAERLPPLREAESVAAAALQRLNIERTNLEAEAQRARERQTELELRRTQLVQDLARESDFTKETETTLSRLDTEQTKLETARKRFQEQEKNTRDHLETASEELDTAEEKLSILTNRTAEHNARHAQLERTVSEEQNRIAGLETQQSETKARLDKLNPDDAGDARTKALMAEVERLTGTATDLEVQVVTAEEKRIETRRLAGKLLEWRNEAAGEAQSLDTEIKTIESLLTPEGKTDQPRLVDAVKVDPGYETALGAALGDDLDASSDKTAAAHWKSLPANALPPLPGAVEPLSRFVNAPSELARRLAMTGVVDRRQGERLQGELKPGQRLVSKQGDLWRWDGYTLAADAPTPAARRLAERNRLVRLNQKARSIRKKARKAERNYNTANSTARDAEQDEQALRTAWREAGNALNGARETLALQEREAQEFGRRRAALEQAIEHINTQRGDSLTRRQAAETDLRKLPPRDELTSELNEARDAAAAKRTQFSDARAALSTVEQQDQITGQRLSAIARERDQWQSRLQNAAVQIKTLTGRQIETDAALAELADLPGRVEEHRKRLMSELAGAEDRRRQAADALQEAENTLRDIERALKAVQLDVAQAREDKARIEARTEAARERREEIANQISATLECEPPDCLQLAGLEAGADLPGSEQTANELERLKQQRERLGGVNLRAEEEAGELTTQYDDMEAEREDLESAIARLRQGIGNLNREGRKRLLEAFKEVNGHFEKLFTTLFGGGEASLKLVGSDDPLEAGLEIVARPPGKKPQVLTLLSGGEKALTALSLIFAVFLTNPSPICVLDEVDAPLDDANVERFCRLLDEMNATTDTRFLVITHHPMTMARMNRLFGVTMSERGVSQLVSVDLETAEQYRESA